MATDYTTNYHLDKYVANDKPNLRDQYNAAMDKIDLALLSANTDATEAKSIAQSASQAVAGKASQADVDLLASAVAKAQDRNVLYYGARRDATPLDPNDWATIFAASIADIGGVVFPAGIWDITDAVTISNCKFFVGVGATLNFTDADAVLHFRFATENNNLRPTLFSGFTINGNGIANVGITQDTANTLFITDCRFHNFLKFCIYTINLGLSVFNCSFFGISGAPTSINLVAIRCTTDNVIANCKIFNCRVGISCTQANIITNCYLYASPSNNNWTAFGIGDFTITNGIVTCNGRMNDATILACEFDTITYVFGACMHSRIISCVFMWDSSASNDNAIFVRDDNFSTTYSLSGVLFNENALILSGITSGKTLHSFKALGSEKFWVFGYVSRDCRIVGGGSGGNVYLAIGCIKGTDYTYPSTNHCKLISQNSGTTAPSPTRFTLDANPLLITPLIFEGYLFKPAISLIITESRPIGYHRNSTAQDNKGYDLYLYQPSIENYGELVLTGHPYEAHVSNPYSDSQIPNTYTLKESTPLQPGSN